MKQKVLVKMTHQKWTGFKGKYFWQIKNVFYKLRNSICKGRKFKMGFATVKAQVGVNKLGNEFNLNKQESGFCLNY